MSDTCQMCAMMAAAQRGRDAWAGETFTAENLDAYLQSLKDLREGLGVFALPESVAALLMVVLENEIQTVPHIVVPGVVSESGV